MKGSVAEIIGLRIVAEYSFGENIQGKSLTYFILIPEVKRIV